MKVISQGFLERTPFPTPLVSDVEAIKITLAKEHITQTPDAKTILFEDHNQLFVTSIILDSSDFIPLIYHKIAYDISHKKIIEKGFYIHRNAHKYLFNPGVKIDDEAQFLSLLKPEFKVIKKAVYFQVEQKIKPSKENALKALIKGPIYRPLRAYYGQISKKNLGRKDYVLSLLSQDLNLRNNQLSLSSMKHPLTYIKTKDHEAINAYTKTLIQNALLNDLSLLIIDEQNMINLDHDEYTLDLRTASPPIGMKDEVDMATLFLKPYDFEDYFETLSIQDEHLAMLNEADYYTQYFQSKEYFHESIVADSLYESRLQEPFICDITTLYDYTYDREELLAYLSFKVYQNHQKLKLKHYKKLHNLLKHSSEINIHKMMKDSFIVHQLKQLYSVFIVKDTDFLVNQPHMFDMVLIIYPKKKHLLDFKYAHKVTMIDDALYQDDCVRSILKHPKGFIKTYLDVSPPDLLIHHIKSNEEINPHVSNEEILAIKDFIHTKPLQVDIRTFFNAQKEAIQDTLGMKTNTLYAPLKRMQTIVSLGLNQSSTQATYDWVKEHPIMIDRLLMSYPFQTHVFLDYDLILKFNTADRFSKLVTICKQQDFKLALFDDTLIDLNIAYYEESIALSKILKGYQNISMHEARYVFYDDHYHLNYVLCLLPPFYDASCITKIKKRFLKESIKVHFINTFELYKLQRKLHILKHIGKVKPL